MEAVDLIGYTATAVGLFTFFPQVVKTWKTKSVKSISLVMYIIFWFGVVCWLGYGLLTGKFPIVVNNIMMFFLISLMIILKIKYNRI